MCFIANSIEMNHVVYLSAPTCHFHFSVMTQGFMITLLGGSTGASKLKISAAQRKCSSTGARLDKFYWSEIHLITVYTV